MDTPPAPTTIKKLTKTKKKAETWWQALSGIQEHCVHKWRDSASVEASIKFKAYEHKYVCIFTISCVKI